MSSITTPAKIKPPKQPLKVPAEAGIAVVFLLVMLGGFIATPNFLTVSNMMVLLLNGAVIGFLCLGQSFVLLTGGIDLSCGSIVAMTCVVAALLMEKFGNPWQLAVPIVLAVGALSGLVNGLIIERTGVPPFIVTFAMMGVAASIPKIITGAESIRVTQIGYSLIGQSKPLGIPFPVIALLLAIVIGVIFLRRTIYNRVEGCVVLASVDDVQRLLMHLPADAVLVISGGGDQKIQRLHSRIAAALGHDVKQLPVGLRVQLVEYHAVGIEAVLVVNIGAEHLIVASSR